MVHKEGGGPASKCQIENNAIMYGQTGATTGGCTIRPYADSLPLSNQFQGGGGGGGGLGPAEGEGGTRTPTYMA